MTPAGPILFSDCLLFTYDGNGFGIPPFSAGEIGYMTPFDLEFYIHIQLHHIQVFIYQVIPD